MCPATIVVVANDDEITVHCHSMESHGLGHMFDVGNVPRDATLVIIPNNIVDDPRNVRDVIVKWSPI